MPRIPVVNSLLSFFPSNRFQSPYIPWLVDRLLLQCHCLFVHCTYGFIALVAVRIDRSLRRIDKLCQTAKARKEEATYIRILVKKK